MGLLRFQYYLTRTYFASPRTVLFQLEPSPSILHRSMGRQSSPREDEFGRHRADDGDEAHYRDKLLQRRKGKEDEARMRDKLMSRRSGDEDDGRRDRRSRDEGDSRNLQGDGRRDDRYNDERHGGRRHHHHRDDHHRDNRDRRRRSDSRERGPDNNDDDRRVALPDANDHRGRSDNRGDPANDNDRRGRPSDEHRRRSDYENDHHHGQQRGENVSEGDIVRGKVVRLEPYGAFVEFSRNCRNRRPGLMHISQLAAHRVDQVIDIVQMGQDVFCRVLQLDDNRTSLGMIGVNQQTGEYDPSKELPGKDGPQRGGGGYGGTGGGGRAVTNVHVERRAEERNRYWDNTRGARPTWRDACDAPRFLWAPSPEPPVNKTAKKKKQRDDSSSDSDSSSSSSSSSSSEESRRRRRKGGGKSRRRRRREVSSSSSSSSESSSSESESSRQDRKRRRKGENDDVLSPPKNNNIASTQEHETPVDEDTLHEARAFKSAVQRPAEDSDDDDDVGPQPLPRSNAALEAAGAGTNAQVYGKALLPGEGQAIAQYVQQNLRVPRRGEIGYDGEEIDAYEKSGYVMSGSRHARMNAIRLRKENQVYSAEEQRALALITMEEKQQKEAALVEDFRKMLKGKQDERELKQKRGK
jgi:predicted RNA-binding protein with RPS1 domain